MEGVYDLAAWLLDNPSNPSARRWDQAALSKAIDAGEKERIRLPQPAPVAWVYLTGWASKKGVVQFRRDIYELDKRAGPPKFGTVIRKGPSP